MCLDSAAMTGMPVLASRQAAGTGTRTWSGPLLMLAESQIVTTRAAPAAVVIRLSMTAAVRARRSEKRYRAGTMTVSARAAPTTIRMLAATMAGAPRIGTSSTPARPTPISPTDQASSRYWRI